jgi:hypothetical protein
MTARGVRGVMIRRLAPLALMPAAAFVVHQLRYWLAFGGRATVELQVQGHTYLHSLVPWIMVLLAVSAGMFLQALGRAFSGHSSVSRFTISFAGLWLLCAAALVGIYACQEFLEGLFLTGHPFGLIGIFGYGGWWAIPAAVAVGLVLAAVFHGAGWVLREVAQRHRRALGTQARRNVPARLPRAILLPRPAPLAGGWSGRGPPA